VDGFEAIVSPRKDFGEGAAFVVGRAVAIEGNQPGWRRGGQRRWGAFRGSFIRYSGERGSGVNFSPQSRVTSFRAIWQPESLLS
jgi:hypothetical protein